MMAENVCIAHCKGTKVVFAKVYNVQGARFSK